jgi:hypothetical protein
MFFRREKLKTPGFQDRLEALRARGFALTIRPDGAVRSTRGSCAADIRESGGGVPPAVAAGILVGDDIAPLVDGGYQKFFRTARGDRKPATAEELVALHNFEEDLKEALGQKTLYNQALGTVSTFYQYDRVENRDRGVPKRAWE